MPDGDDEQESICWQKQPGAHYISLVELREKAGMVLPPHYLQFLERCNGGEGELSVAPMWLVMWPAERLIEYNRELEMETYAPGFFAFGGDGGGEIFAFAIDEAVDSAVYRLPILEMTPDKAKVIAANFDAFAACIGKAPAQEKYLL
jgi:hypothetical protein